MWSMTAWDRKPKRSSSFLNEGKQLPCQLIDGCAVFAGRRRLFSKIGDDRADPVADQVAVVLIGDDDVGVHDVLRDGFDLVYSVGEGAGIDDVSVTQFVEWQAQSQYQRSYIL